MVRAGAVDRARRARHLAGEGLAAQLGLGHDDLLPRLDQLRIRLRHVDVDPQRIHLGQHEQRLAAAVDQVAGVDRAPRDHARERCGDAGEALHLAQPLDVGVGGGEVGVGLGGGAALLVELLLRDDVALAQGLPALGGALRQREAGRRLLAGGDRLRQLLVDLRRLDLGEQLALLDRGADVPASSASGSRWRGRRSATAARPAACRAGPGSGRCRSTLAKVVLTYCTDCVASGLVERLGIGQARQHGAAGAEGEQHQHDRRDDGAAAHRPAARRRVGARRGRGVGCGTRLAHRLSSPAGAAPRRRRGTARSGPGGAAAGRGRRHRRPARTAASRPSQKPGRR